MVGETLIKQKIPFVVFVNHKVVVFLNTNLIVMLVLIKLFLLLKDCFLNGVSVLSNKSDFRISLVTNLNKILEQGFSLSDFIHLSGLSKENMLTKQRLSLCPIKESSSIVRQAIAINSLLARNKNSWISDLYLLEQQTNVRTEEMTEITVAVVAKRMELI